MALRSPTPSSQSAASGRRRRGFAGDFLPVARAHAAVAECVISHPNVEAFTFIGVERWESAMPSTLYVEGYSLDRFAEGSWDLRPLHHNLVGSVLDSGIEEELRLRHLHVADAARASLGYNVTDAPLEIKTLFDPKCWKSTGSVGNSDSLLRPVEALMNHSDVNAVAVVACFPDDDPEDSDCYREGKIRYTFLPCVASEKNTEICGDSASTLRHDEWCQMARQTLVIIKAFTAGEDGTHKDTSQQAIGEQKTVTSMPHS
ncbi:hypothetical protein ABZP36_015638 [Zizania latifolia]